MRDIPDARHLAYSSAAASRGWLDLGPGWLFTSILDAVVVADAQTARIVLWNPAATQLFGYSAAEALELGVSDVARDLEACPEWAAVQAGRVARQTVELVARCKSDADVPVELTLSRLETVAAGRAYVLAVVRDIST